MTQQLPMWAVVVLVIVLVVWTVGMNIRTETGMLSWWVARTEGSAARTIGVTTLLHLGLTLWCLTTVFAALVGSESLGAGTWAAGFIACVAVGSVAPWIMPFVPTRTDLGPAHEDLRAAGAPTSAARAIRWTSFPFAVVEMVALIASLFAALVV